MTTTDPGAARRPTLTRREKQVLLTWLRCDSKGTTGSRLYISPATVSTHIERIRRKYAAAGRPARTKCDLFVRVVQDGIVQLDEW
ncbi:LuxR C-terminal-related transcriptional regulator [Skermania piniformis]|uniref:LuxR C-terminal-related transcriptional regulator n=1 Tax=Skermania pinensis TaxID=39122 RepID=A0ABX8SBT7_9ACTN|nr:LuxR C-terminal-related transcriptional regulator [Skermania piniformis]QXQ15329.1 LuxR C-terminal-related transcriptional regulator [Skermania piniformis]